MTHLYDRAKTLQYFGDQARLYDLYRTETGPCSRDAILLEKILPYLADSRLKIIDYGCGAGGLLEELAKRRHDVIGIDPNPTLRQSAIEKLQQLGYPEDRVKLGGLEQLSSIHAGDIDMVVAMGVFQYLSNEEYAGVLAEIHRVLKPRGHLVCTFQNALFDLFTFNKYTVDFFEHQLFPLFEPLGLDVQRALVGLKTLITHPDLPVHDASRARDNIFVRLSNPLTIGDELGRSGYSLKNLYFYTLHPVPPLVANDQGEMVKRITETIEVEKSQEWYAYFLGNAFLTHCRAR